VHLTHPIEEGADEMQTQGLTTFEANQASTVESATASSRWGGAPRIVISAVFVGAAIGAWSAVAMDRFAGAGSIEAAQAAPIVAAAPVLDPPADATHATGRALVIAIPTDDDYLTSATIPVAGMALGRPHGPKVSTVHVELLASGRVVGSTDLDVQGGRFAGALQLDASADLKDAELRVSEPGYPQRTARIQNLTIDPR
jgi:hypothetical protein